MNGQIAAGKVKRWYEDKGFGFLSPDDGGTDIFVHRNSLQDGQGLIDGAPVTFELQWNAKKNKYEATKCWGATAGGGGGGMMMMGGKGNKPMSEPSDNLFVAGWSLDTSEERIKEVFGQYGTVRQVKILSDVPGKPDRAALVRVDSVDQAKWMVENMNGNIPVGLTTPLVVRFADNRAERARAAEGPKGWKGGGKGSKGYSPYDGKGGGAAALGALGNDASSLLATISALAAQPQLAQLLAAAAGAAGN